MASVRVPRIRVLLAARDRRFLAVTSFLLSRSGYVVETSRRPSALLELVKPLRPDVVVLDGSESVEAARQAASQLQSLDPRISVLVVAEENGEPSGGQPGVLPKWSSLERLAEEVETVYLRAHVGEEAVPGVS